MPTLPRGRLGPAIWDSVRVAEGCVWASHPVSGFPGKLFGPAWEPCVVQRCAAVPCSDRSQHKGTVEQLGVLLQWLPWWKGQWVCGTVCYIMPWALGQLTNLNTVPDVQQSSLFTVLHDAFGNGLGVASWLNWTQSQMSNSSDCTMKCPTSNKGAFMYCSHNL